MTPRSNDSALTLTVGRVSWTLLDQLVVSGGSLLTNILVARTLGIEGFGLFALSWLVVLLAQSIQTALITSPLMTISPKLSGPSSRHYHAAVFVMQLGLAAFLVALLVAVSFAGSSFGLRHWINDLVLPLCALLFFSQVHEYMRRYLYTVTRGPLPFLQALTRNGIQVGVLGLVAAGLVPISIDVQSALWLCAGASGVASICFIALAPSPLDARENLVSTARRNLPFAKWQLGSSLLHWLTGHLVTIITGALLGAVGVGALRAGQTLLGVTHILFQAADNIVPQHASRVLESEGVAGLTKFVRRFALVAGLSTAAIGLFFGALPDFWLVFIFGPSYEGYGYVVTGFAVAYCLMALAMPLRFLFVATEETRPVFLGYAAAAVTSVLLSPVLVAGLAVYGSLTAIIATQLAMLFTFWTLARRRFGPLSAVSPELSS